MKEHNYKDFILKRSGYSKTPWNIYTKEGDWLGYAETLKQSKLGIDDGCYDEEAKAAKKMREINKKIDEKKKKPAFGAFVTLDAGDVEKTIDIFNDSVSDNISGEGLGESLTEELLEEGKIVTFDGKTNPTDGWIVVMAGGSGSGKGFVFDTLVPFHGKKLDPDELKPYIIKTSEIMGDTITFKDGSKVNLEDAGIYPPYSLKNPDFVALIHNHPLTRRLKKQQKDMLFKGASNADPSRRPNIIFDMTLDEISKIEAIVDTYKPLGYKIAIVYALTPIDVAIEQNAKRARSVRKDILLAIHRGVYNTLPQIIEDKELSSQIDEIWVVQQYSINIKNRQEVVDYIKKASVTRIPKSADGIKYLEADMMKFIEQQLSRIAELEKEMHDDNIKAIEDDSFGTSIQGGKMIERYLPQQKIEEDINDFVNVVSMEQMREGSIDNMDDEDIDFQEKTFAHISRMLKANDADIVAIEYSSGYYDYDPDYLDKDIETKTFRYGELCNMDGIKFYKEAKYPFLYFRNEDDLNKYIDIYNREMEYDL